MKRGLKSKLFGFYFCDKNFVMKYNPEIHKRKSIRLKGYDYSQNGAYFITICTEHRECLFGTIRNGKMVLNEIGTIARNELEKTSTIRKYMTIDCFIVMPNHVHAIVIIDNPVGAYCNTPLRGKFKSPSNNLGAMIRGYKSTVTKKINQFRQTYKKPIWQRNYYEHIIRNEESFQKISDYIIANPQSWGNDKLYS
jgi:REP element-mobilizing transposase RayT